MIPLHAFDVTSKKMTALIKNEIEHSYLDKYIKKPIIDEEKIFILSKVLNHTTLSEHVKEQYIITTMLVQIALDTHDLVPVENNTNENEDNKTSMQLSVLAGDYYSGLYYLFLSRIEDIKMIQTLSSAIKEINEYKMLLYYNETSSFHNYIEYVGLVDSLLITRVAEHVNMIPEFIDLIGKILITNKLIKEKRNIYNTFASPALNNWFENSTTCTYSSILNNVESIIQKNTRDIEAMISQSSKQLSIFRSSIDYLLEELIYKKISIVEEG